MIKKLRLGGEVMSKVSISTVLRTMINMMEAQTSTTFAVAAV